MSRLYQQIADTMKDEKAKYNVLSTKFKPVMVETSKVMRDNKGPFEQSSSISPLFLIYLYQGMR